MAEKFKTSGTTAFVLTGNGDVFDLIVDGYRDGNPIWSWLLPRAVWPVYSYWDAIPMDDDAWSVQNRD